MTGPVEAVALARACREGTLDPMEVVRSCFVRIRAAESQTRAFLHWDEKACLARAQILRRDGPPPEGSGLLFGVPVAVKDNICVKGSPMTAGSRILSGYLPPYHATVVRRILDEGAVIVGKTNLDEFAMGSSTEFSAYQATRNPWNPTCTPGGSSGGSAAAVASAALPLALGSDTGGSIRQPAALCGVVGFKPTYGRVSRYGLVSFASSLDQIGPLAATVRDAALLYRVTAGADPRDSTTRSGPPDLSEENPDSGLRGVKVGVPDEYLSQETDPSVRESLSEGLRLLAEAGAEIRGITLPCTRHALSAYYLVANSEASSNLARYDGMRYGPRAQGRDLAASYRATRQAGFGPEVKRRIMLGTFALSEGYHEAYYGRALEVRGLIRDEFRKAFEEVDLIAGPTSPIPAFSLGERLGDPLAMYQCDTFTTPASLAGLPALSVPCGLTPNGLPVGLQMLGPPLSDARVLLAGRAFEKRRGAFSRAPLAEKVLAIEEGGP